MRLQPGTFLQGDKYRIIDVLGQGGFGITYLAEQVMAERKVCIKEFFPKEYYKRDDDSHSISLGTQGSAEIMDLYKAKFVKEAKTIAKLDHPNIIHIFDVFTENNTAYYVMEYIEGESLSDVVKRNGGALSESVAVDYIKQAASALGYIHERKIMHLDVKPANIMLRKEDGRPILIDFGLSKQYDAEGNQTSSTPVGISAGFAPMEQYQQGGVKEFSPETDIYSLGASLYYLVTGCVPPQAAAIVDDGLPELPAHLSANVRNAIERSMEIQRKKRPHSMNEFVALLDDSKKVVPIIPAPQSESTVIAAASANIPDESTKLGEAPTPTPKAEAPKKEWTPKHSEEKPKKSDNNKKKSRWWMWLLILLLIGGGAWFVIGNNRGENTESVEENVTLPETVAPYQVGDLYNENGKQGVVFEVLDNGRHGKIVSLDKTCAKWDSRVKWSNSEQVFINGTMTGANDKSDGKANTDKVMKRGDSDQYPAFVWCRNKGEDWYLPAIDELEAILNNESAINSTLAKYGAKLSDDEVYWSSTEYEDKPEFCAWGVYMGSGYTNIYNKFSINYVRAVSAF
ncbi:MAG: DUF1566 domain-containing protein [Rikenellaceae bacterium]|nr:DUF1566 domain-containing protein [Rikenellaceae bacterium]